MREKMPNAGKTLSLLICCISMALVLAGCSGSDKTTIVQTIPAPVSKNPLNASKLQQFANPLIIIPAAPADPKNPNFFTVIAKQKSDFDFGLRNIHDGSVFTDPATGKPIKTTTWGYEVNGLFLGIYGPTIEARTGTPIQVKYINDLRDSSGNLLTRHILPVDTTLDGANQGEPEVRIVTHLHGGHVESIYDGHPEAWITNDPAVQAKWAAPADPVTGRPARPATNSVTYTYRNDQQAATLWFHDHAMGITRLNPYAGLAAFYLIRDTVEDTLNLPKGQYEIPLVLQDKSFYEDGSLSFKQTTLLSSYTNTPVIGTDGKPILSGKPEFFGDVIMVNAQAWPYLDVEPRRYRFRMVNGSDSRMYNIWFQDATTGQPITRDMLSAGESWPVVQIGSDQGLADKAVEVATGKDIRGLLLGNGERADVIIDFSHRLFAGRSIIVRNDAPAPFSGDFGPDAEDPVTLDSKTTGKIMKFNVKKPLSGKDTTPATTALLAGVRPFTPLSDPKVDTSNNNRVRYLDLQERVDTTYAMFDPATGTTSNRLQTLINGLRFNDPITEKPVLNAIEEWVIINTTPDVHPMHLHQVAFQVIEKGYLRTDGTDGNYIRADGAGMMPFVNPDALIRSAIPPDPDPDTAPQDAIFTAAPNELFVWKDTVKVPPAQTAGPGTVINPGYVRVRARFDILGTYMWHCHILSHEEFEMMRPFTVVATKEEAVTTFRKKSLTK